MDSGAAGADIITFNQDLEIEKALTTLEAHKKYSLLGPLFAPPFSYGSPFAGARSYGPGHVARFKTYGTEPPTYIGVFKLHGSLNWASVHDSPQPPFEEVLSRERELRWTSRRDLRGDPKVKEGGRQRFALPYVIPPVQNKAAIMSEDVATLWDEAEVVLVNADEVTFVGYSCPLTDIEAESLFRRALKANAGLTKLTVVNPDPGVLARFGPMAAGVPIVYFRSLEEWTSRGLP